MASADRPAASPATANASGFEETTSRLEAPMDPVDPRMMNRFKKTSEKIEVRSQESGVRSQEKRLV